MLAVVATLLLTAAMSVEVDPDVMQGRTAAAIADFRSAVGLEADAGHGGLRG